MPRLLPKIDATTSVGIAGTGLLALIKAGPGKARSTR